MRRVTDKTQRNQNWDLDRFWAFTLLRGNAVIKKKESQASDEGGKMLLTKLPSWLSLIFLLAGCDLATRQYPAGSILYPPGQASGNAQSPSSPQPQVTGAQRTQHMLDTAMQAMVIGAAVGGIYGAGGGFLIGLISGFFTADAHYTVLNNQIQLEQAKTNDLEAKIEEELQRQRELEARLANTPGSPLPAKAPEPPQPEQKPADAKVTTVVAKEASGPTQSSTPTSAVASVNVTKGSPSSSSTSPFKNVEMRDINGDGVPDLWIYYNPLRPTEVVRQEEASHGDGRVDTWTYFQNGKMVRREVDTKGKGTADTTYYYENEQIVREDRDANASGYVTFRAIYKNGRRAKVEEDTTGSGKPDHWIYYDTSADGDVVLKEERDLNGDGAVDVWSYYENGRLVRRDVSAIGLELLAQQDQAPSSPDR